MSVGRYSPRPGAQPDWEESLRPWGFSNFYQFSLFTWISPKMRQMAFKHKLTAQEIKLACEKIRQEYDHFIVRYMKTPGVKKQFEDRLYMADLKRMDMTFFIAQEMKVLQELILQAETEKVEAERKAATASQGRTTVQGKSYADRVIERLQKQIEDYPSLPIHPGVGPDVEKLFGTINWIYTSLWPNFSPILRDQGLALRLLLEDEFPHLTPHNGRLPKDLDHLAHLIDTAAPLNQQSQQQKICLVKGASLIHHLHKATQEALGRRVTKGQKEYLEKVQAYLSKVIVDFRLKNISPS